MQANFSYDMAEASRDGAGVPLSVSVYADRPHIRDTIRDDALAAGLREGECSNVDGLDGAAATALGDITIIDCPRVDARMLALLIRLDIRAAQSGNRLIVSTSAECIDAVFGCLDQSGAELLVDPGRGERVIALGRLLAKMPNMRVRDLADEDRLTLIRLTEQVGQIAETLERIGAPGKTADGGAFRLGSPTDGYRGQNSDEGSRQLIRKGSVRPMKTRSAAAPSVCAI